MIRKICLMVLENKQNYGLSILYTYWQKDAISKFSKSTIFKIKFGLIQAKYSVKF
uniref:Uncharacterized protein n=1 Tax=Meloidogyne enterolobii TaxID=390850 RepID=A0A6V7W0H2_MELEN|nr:unnamed protein product [Meloidogyne enterolobii]